VHITLVLVGGNEHSVGVVILRLVFGMGLFWISAGTLVFWSVCHSNQILHANVGILSQLVWLDNGWIVLNPSEVIILHFCYLTVKSTILTASQNKYSHLSGQHYAIN